MAEDAQLRHIFDSMRAALELVEDGILFADNDDRVLYANASVTRIAGLDHAPAPGEPALALLVEAEAAGARVARIPRTGFDGQVAGWTAVLREPRVHVHAEQQGGQVPSDATLLLDLIATTRPGGTLDDTALRICEAVAALPGIDGAMILLLPPEGDLIHLQHAGRAGVPFKSGQRLPLRDIEPIIDMTLSGPWAVATLSADALRMFGVLALPLRVAGITATAYAGMRVGGRLLGVLSVASKERDGLARLQERLELLAQLAAVAGAVIAGQATDFGRQEAMRGAVRACLEQGSFRPVFQPIVRLHDGSVYGYEALTRFDDERPPDEHFLEAHLVGLGVELEAAAVKRALEAARAFPAGTRVSVNLSPDALTALAADPLLQEAPLPIVIEVTEHARVDDYRALAERLATVPHLTLSVDDAGAGFASLRHILELQPEYVKLDIGLVRDVHVDPARSAMVAGVSHFARVTGKTLIAEGVENAEDAQALRALGVDLAQGYHFGRPEPIDHWLR